MSLDIHKPWIATSQSYWETMIYEDCPPSRDWFRVWAAAMARCQPNLHAEFKPGELSHLLGRPVGSEFVPMASNRLSNLIAELKQRGLLDSDSGQHCLVLPAMSFGCDLPGSKKPCQTHAKKISRPRKAPRVSVGCTPEKESKRESESSQVTALPIHSQNVRRTSPQCMDRLDTVGVPA